MQCLKVGLLPGCSRAGAAQHAAPGRTDEERAPRTAAAAWLTARWLLFAVAAWAALLHLLGSSPAGASPPPPLPSPVVLALPRVFPSGLSAAAMAEGRSPRLLGPLRLGLLLDTQVRRY